MLLKVGKQIQLKDSQPKDVWQRPQEQAVEADYEYHGASNRQAEADDSSERRRRRPD